MLAADQPPSARQLFLGAVASHPEQPASFDELILLNGLDPEAALKAALELITQQQLEYVGAAGPLGERRLLLTLPPRDGYRCKRHELTLHDETVLKAVQRERSAGYKRLFLVSRAQAVLDITPDEFHEALFRLVDAGELTVAWRGPGGDQFRFERADELQQVMRWISGGLDGL